MGLKRHPKYQNIDDEVVRTKEVEGGHVIAFIPSPNRESVEEIGRKVAIILLRDHMNNQNKSERKD